MILYKNINKPIMTVLLFYFKEVTTVSLYQQQYEMAFFDYKTSTLFLYEAFIIRHEIYFVERKPRLVLKSCFVFHIMKM